MFVKGIGLGSRNLSRTARSRMIWPEPELEPELDPEHFKNLEYSRSWSRSWHKLVRLQSPAVFKNFVKSNDF